MSLLKMPFPRKINVLSGIAVLTLGIFVIYWSRLLETTPCHRVEITESDCSCVETVAKNHLQQRFGTPSSLRVENEAIERSASVGRTYKGANSLPGHTGPGIPKIFRALLKSKAVVDEDADTFYGAAAAVDTLEKECGWDPVTSNFRNESCFAGIDFDSKEHDPLTTLKLADLVDIVVPSIRDLDFLEDWREFIEPLHIIIIQDGDPSKVLKIPPWANYELYNRRDIENHLGRHRSWFISTRDSSIRNFGFIVSRKPYIYTLDDDCLPAVDAQGNRVNAIAEHVRNLMKPATPYFYNTLFDPYRPGSDFVRGYPFSLRNGVPTVISHGLWLNAPDYDAPTQLLKVKERNQRLHDVVMTVPHGTLYPMCSMNVAFDRKLIGPAFMQGLMGDGQPWARYEDMFAGWCSKVVLDHLGYGAKNGAPYIYHNKASNPFTNLKKEYKGFWWQEDLIAFFKQVRLSNKATNAATAYRELSFLIQERFESVHPYFGRVTKGMRHWLDVLEEAEAGKIEFKPSRSSKLDRVSNPRNTADVSKDSDCLTYEERYRKCRSIRRMPLDKQRKIFNQASTGYLATEAAILRLSNEEWLEDFWLNVCAFVTETGEDGTRIPVLLTNKSTVDHVPWEFRSLVKVQDDTILNRIFGEHIYISGHYHGDQLGAIWLLLDRPELNFIWIFENDIRYSGHYGGLLARSRKWGLENLGVNATAMPKGVESHLILYSPLIRHPEYPFIKRDDIFQGEYRKYRTSSQYFGALTPMFGMSRFLATKLVEQNFLGNSATMLEANIPCTILSVLEKTGVFPKVSVIPLNSALYNSLHKWNDAKMHRPWMQGETFTADHFLSSTLESPHSINWYPHPVGKTFVGQRCLADYLMHPVKLIDRT